MTKQDYIDAYIAIDVRPNGFVNCYDLNTGAKRRYLYYSIAEAVNKFYTDVVTPHLDRIITDVKA